MTKRVFYTIAYDVESDEPITDEEAFEIANNVDIENFTFIEARVEKLKNF